MRPPSHTALRTAHPTQNVCDAWSEPTPAPCSYAQTRTTLVYAVVGLLWIFLSDRALEALGFVGDDLNRLQTYKGFAFVAVTTALLYVLIAQVTRSLERANAELREKHRAFWTLVGNLPGGVYRRSIAGEFQFLSTGAAALLIPDAATAGGRDFLERIHPEDRARVAAQLARAIDTGSAYELTYRVPSAKREVRWVWDQGRPVEGEGERGVLEGYVSDISESHMLRERLFRAQRLEGLGRMAAGIAHDFNNVLFAVGAGCDLLGTQPLTETESELVGQIQAAGQSGRGLVSQLLSFAREQGGKAAELELDPAIRRSEPILRRLLDKRVSLSLSLGACQGKLRVDPTQLEQILLNLVMNAVQAVRAQGEIKICTECVTLSDVAAEEVRLPSGRYQALSVSDNGCGIEESVLPHIFEPFFTTKGEAGTGLGLSTVHDIVRAAGGAITVTSKLGRGTTFRVLLPQLEPALGAPVTSLAS